LSVSATSTRNLLEAGAKIAERKSSCSDPFQQVQTEDNGSTRPDC